MKPVAKIGHKEDQRFVRQVDWNLFRSFFEIGQSGSLSGAARRLNMHQPGLSLALKRLEDNVGFSLCRRTAQGIELTAAGRAVFQQAADMDEIIRLVPHLAAQAAKRVEGTLSIWMISDIISPELDEALASILSRHTDIELKIEIATWREVLDAVSSGQCDLAVTYESEALPDLRYEPLIKESQQLYSGRNHPLYGHRIRNPATLSDERFILAAADEPKSVENFRLHFGLGKHTTGYADDLHEAMRLIRLGVGIGFLPTVVAESLADRLWPILPPQLLPSYFIYLIASTASRLSTPTQLFHDEILRRLRSRPDLG